jgi:lycopene cyclase CruP
MFAVPTLQSSRKGRFWGTTPAFPGRPPVAHLPLPVCCCSTRTGTGDPADPLESFLGRVQAAPALRGLQAADASWKRLQQTGSAAVGPPEEVVTCCRQPEARHTKPSDFDVVVLGGTLGILIGTALLRRNSRLRVVVVERGALRGRDQEWNTSRRELEVLVATGVLSHETLEKVIRSEWRSMRVGVEAAASRSLPDLSTFMVQDILNIGVSPRALIDEALAQFTELGGQVWEWCQFQGAETNGRNVLVRLECVPGTVQRPAVALGAGGDQAILATPLFRTSMTAESPSRERSSEPIRKQIRPSLVLDCMGNASPIVRQQRELVYGQKRPDAVCMVVGSCCRAHPGHDPFPDNTSGDLIYSFTPASSSNRLQYLWEAFPSDAGSNRTTYLFTYLDADARRAITLTDLYRDYLGLLPVYQGGHAFHRGDRAFLDRLQPQRALFGFFPAYERYAPLPTALDNVLPIGDASGVQSPLSFGGFGAMLRHLPRLVDAICEALAAEALSAEDLRCIQPYLPSLSVTWLFQRALSYRVPSRASQTLDERVVNEILGWSLLTMQDDESALRPFLQDVIQFPGLVRTLARTTVRVPALVPRILGHIGGPVPLLGWLRHLMALGVYDQASRLFHSESALSSFIDNRLKDPKKRFRWHRQLEAWRYGSGRDLHID